MATIRRTFILTGGRQGKTCQLKVGIDFANFVNGKLTLTGPQEDIENFGIYLAKSYQCYPEGSLELQKLLKGEPIHGERDLYPKDVFGTPKSIPSNVQQGGKGVAQVPSEDLTGDVGDQGGNSRVLSSGDGHTNTRVPEQETELSTERLKQAALKLDPMNDEHWTTQGLIRLDAIEKFYGDGAVNRKMVDEVLPDYNREAALEREANKETVATGE